MAKRKQKPSEMPPDIDLEEWELMVQEKRERLALDNEFLALCEWLKLADTASDCIRHQFKKVFPDPKEQEVLESLLGELSGMGWAMEDPEGWLGNCEDVDDYAAQCAKFGNKRLPEPLSDLLNRLVFYSAKWAQDMRHKNNGSIYDF